MGTAASAAAAVTAAVPSLFAQDRSWATVVALLLGNGLRPPCSPAEWAPIFRVPQLLVFVILAADATGSSCFLAAGRLAEVAPLGKSTTAPDKRIGRRSSGMPFPQTCKHRRMKRHHASCVDQAVFPLPPWPEPWSPRASSPAKHTGDDCQGGGEAGHCHRRSRERLQGRREPREFGGSGWRPTAMASTGCQWRDGVWRSRITGLVCSR